MGILSSLFGSSKQTTTQSTSLPPWLQGPASNLAQYAQQAMSQPYVPLNPNNYTAFIKNQPNLGQAQGILGGMMNPGANGLNNFLNPYVGGVVDEIGRLGIRQLHEQVLPGVSNTFTGSGQFGSSRHADFTGRAIRDSMRDIAGQQAAALSGAYDSAMTNYLGASSTAFNGNLGIAQLMQNDEQHLRDNTYAEGMRQQDWYNRNLGAFAGAMNGVPDVSTTTTTQPGPSRAGQLLGLGLGIAGLGAQFGLWGGGR